MRLAKLDPWHAQLLESLRDGPEQLDRVRVLDALHEDVGRETNAYPGHSDFGAHPLQHVRHEAQPVLDRTTVLVGAEVGAVAQELIDEIAVGAVDLDAVEAGLDRVARRSGIVADNPLDFVVVESARRNVGLLAFVGMSEVWRFRRRGTYGPATAEIWMNEASHVPKLRYDPAARVMNRRGHSLPPFNLIRAPQSRRIRPPETLAADPGRLRDDEASRRALRIISGNKVVRDALAVGAGACQRRHRDPVGKVQRPELERVE